MQRVDAYQVEDGFEAIIVRLQQQANDKWTNQINVKLHMIGLFQS